MKFLYLILRLGKRTAEAFVIRKRRPYQCTYVHRDFFFIAQKMEELNHPESYIAPHTWSDGKISYFLMVKN